MKYTYTVGPAMGSTRIDKERVFADLIESCDDLNDCDNLIVYNFGVNGDLMLDILKDSEYDPESGEYNIVTITTSQKKDMVIQYVDDTEDTYVTDGSLEKELERIWNYQNFGLL